jgi:acetate kinase
VNHALREAGVARPAFLPPFKALVIPADEEMTMAIHARALLEEGR